MNILYILIGAVLLILGRKYAWIFTAGIVYFVTLEFITKVLPDFPYILVLFIALVFAASGALLASLTKSIGTFLAGLLSGGYLFALLAAIYNWFPGQFWMPYLVGGALGLVLVAGAADWTMVVFSSLVGALMVTRGTPIKPAWLMIAFLGLTLAGVIIQLLIMLIERPEVPVPIQEKAEEEDKQLKV